MAVIDITTKELEKQKRRENYLKNKERILKNNAKSREKNREKVLQGKKDYYNKVKHTEVWQEKQKELRAKNKEKKSLYDMAYHQKHKDIKTKRAVLWNAENKEKRSCIIFTYDSKRREIKKTGCSSKELHHWKQKQIKKCYWCGIDCKDNFHVDHYEPLAKGGKHILENLVISCPKCNVKKNAKDPIKFANSLGRLF